VRLGRGIAWMGVIVLVELVARAIVYGMAPSAGEASRALGGHLGGPGFVATLLVAMGLGALISTGLVWMASMGVRERWALAEQRLEGSPPRVRVGLLLRRTLALTLVGWLTFAGIETVIHMREGLGFHGIECLIGPVHRNALPVIGGLALLASALTAAAALVLAWMRRTVGRLVAPRAVVRRRLTVSGSVFSSVSRRAPLVLAAAPRGPPLVVA
jgi:hypothetical protein